MKTFFWISVLVLTVLSAHSRPQYSMLTGNRCISCHTSNQGAGLRNELGAYSKAGSELFSYENDTYSDVIDKISSFNTLLDGKLRWGMDYRLQSAKLGGPENSKRETFTMQASPYVSIKPLNWLEVFGKYNFSPRVYPSQNRWNAFIEIQPDYTYPVLRIGMLRPSIGVFYDDHTLLLNQVATPARALQLIPPEYSELGAELSYDVLKIINLTTGIYKSEYLSKNFVETAEGFTNLVSKEDLSGLVRIALTPRFYSNQINSNIGVSYLFNSDFSLSNFFLHLGWTDNLSLLTEYAYSKKNDLRETNNFLVELLYHFFESVDLSARYESGKTTYLFNDFTYNSNQYVFGANIYLLPFIELRPEYRIYDRDFVNSYHSQWAFQFHVYF